METEVPLSCVLRDGGRPERTHRRKAMETVSSPTILPKVVVSREDSPPKGNGDRRWVRDFAWRERCPERTHRRKAMETRSCANLGWRWSVLGPERTHRRKAMETPYGDGGYRRSSWSREDSPPKGNGDLCQPSLHELCQLCPERTHRRKAMETARVLCAPRSSLHGSREDSPPKGNGDDCCHFFILLMSVAASREDSPPKGNGDKSIVP